MNKKLTKIKKQGQQTLDKNNLETLYNDRMKIYNKLNQDLRILALEKRKAMLNMTKPINEKDYDDKKKSLIEKYKIDVYPIDNKIRQITKRMK